MSFNDTPQSAPTSPVSMGNPGVTSPGYQFLASLVNFLRPGAFARDNQAPAITVPSSVGSHCASAEGQELLTALNNFVNLITRTEFGSKPLEKDQVPDRDIVARKDYTIVKEEVSTGEQEKDADMDEFKLMSNMTGTRFFACSERARACIW